MVAGGIGVTPFASVLRHMYDELKNFYIKKNIKEAEKAAALAKLKAAGKRPPRRPRNAPPEPIEGFDAFETVRFIWSARDDDSFTWFGSKMEDLVTNWDMLNMEVYLSSRDTHDICNLGFRMLMKYGKDVDKSYGGKRQPVALKLGRPDYNAIFKKIKVNHPDSSEKIGVFYCGPKVVKLSLGRTINAVSDHECTFDFHPEFFHS